MSAPRPYNAPDTDAPTGHREVDPVTGYDTTGHDWNGIRELNTPFPRIVVWALGLTFLYSVVTWVLLPAWPTGHTYTRGLLGLDQSEAAVERLREVDAVRQGWLARFDDPDFTALAADRDLMAWATPAADRLYQDNCAACHGFAGGGGPGFPDLRDTAWLWGGDPETVAETLRHGINAPDPDTRIAEMPAFDWLDRSERRELAAYVAALPTGDATHDSPAGFLFAENCEACHGAQGGGGLMNGAPSLADAAVIYGQDPGTVMETLRVGRRGVMPAWGDRLSAAEINLLASYVSRVSENGKGGRE
ncbi:cytochrome-c oxidase, cbb3-type subunit III [Limibaculum sp. M0105]|uniref:Cbb3-type cytochrome c oxidase subunit n=1 Tax=Thermohalobaculum xanthum TaxID=2753746 RepID=A0A8J7MBM1_9RHOB|nr:cytochrome-c oxidase, cbb3-type subunit III [Thermohalobaculum xanthum]MBK0401313.1 cytochrome-c oxidase, cbb3-type subunit III [Thermohalobaculum xanthum]